MAKPLLILGTSGHAKVVLDAVQAGQTYEVVGFLDSFLEPGTLRHGLEVFGPPLAAAGVASRYRDLEVFVAVGDNWSRASLTGDLEKHIPGLKFATVIHPAAVVSRWAALAPGCTVFPGAVVAPGCVLGEGAIVNTSASVDHDCRLGRFSSVAPGAHLGGNVELGERSSVGIGAVLKHALRVGPDTVIGAGAVVLDDIPGEVVAYGVPARVARTRTADEKYL